MLYPEERETLINIAYHAHTIEVYTTDPQIMKKLNKLSQKFPDHYQLTEELHDDNGELISQTYQMPRKLLRFSSPRFYTEEQREKMRQRGLEASKKNFSRKKGDS